MRLGGGERYTLCHSTKSEGHDGVVGNRGALDSNTCDSDVAAIYVAASAWLGLKYIPKVGSQPPGPQAPCTMLLTLSST